MNQFAASITIHILIVNSDWSKSFWAITQDQDHYGIWIEKSEIRRIFISRYFN